MASDAESFGDTILPLTYVNSTAAIKSFVGKHGGATVTSSNAKKMLEVGVYPKRTNIVSARSASGPEYSV